MILHHIELLNGATLVTEEEEDCDKPFLKLDPFIIGTREKGFKSDGHEYIVIESSELFIKNLLPSTLEFPQGY